jgi:hypothetical protein
MHLLASCIHKSIISIYRKLKENESETTVCTVPKDEVYHNFVTLSLSLQVSQPSAHLFISSRDRGHVKQKTARVTIIQTYHNTLIDLIIQVMLNVKTTVSFLNMLHD